MDLFVGAVLLDFHQQIYLIKEDDKNQIGKNRWNLPGGSVDGSESLLEAFKRETKEETGYTVEPKSLLGCYKCVKGANFWLYVVLEASVVGEKKSPLDPDIKEGKWFSKEDFLKIDSSELVHSDMKLVYQIALKNRGLPLETVKFISYD